jgi:hypothetical protein
MTESMTGHEIQNAKFKMQNEPEPQFCILNFAFFSFQYNAPTFRREVRNP